MRFFSIFIVVIFTFFAISTSHAKKATPDEIEEMLIVNKEYKKVDDELLVTWKRIYGGITDKEQKDKLLQQQRKWIKSGRNDAAEKYQSQGESFINSYIKATIDRNNFLKSIANDSPQKEVAENHDSQKEQSFKSIERKTVNEQANKSLDSVRFTDDITMFVKVNKYYDPYPKSKYIHIVSQTDELVIKCLDVNHGNAKIQEHVKKALPISLRYGDSVDIALDTWYNVLSVRLVTSKGNMEFVFQD